MSTILLAINEFANVRAAWDEINEAHFQHPLLESRFVVAALAQFGTGQEQIAITGPLEAPDAIAIIAPAKLGAWQTFQISQAPLGALIAKPGLDFGGLTKGLFAALPKTCQVFSVTQQDPDLQPRPAERGTIRTLDYIETARISVDRDFNDYWSGRGKNLRHNMKRQSNRLEREGVHLRLETLTKPEEMCKGVESYGNLESQGWKAEGGTAIHLDNEQGKFYTAMLEAYAETGNARIFRFYYDEKLSAVDLCILNESALIILKTTYDETINTSSPALQMRLEYFPQIFDSREVKRIEFYGKVMDWHTKWSDEIRTMYHVNAYRSALVAKLHNRS